MIGAALRIAFEAIMTIVLFSVSCSTYRAAAKMDQVRPDTSAMIGLFFLGGGIALLLLAQSLLKLRRPPNDKGAES